MEGLNLPTPKLEFPTLTGPTPSGWLYRCERFFQMCQIPEYSQMQVVTMREGRNMGQRVLIEGMTWDEFALSSDRQV
jgi:hypothetical protein